MRSRRSLARGAGARDEPRVPLARHEGRRVHPRDGVEDEHVEAAVAILRGGPDAAP